MKKILILTLFLLAILGGCSTIAVQDSQVQKTIDLEHYKAHIGEHFYYINFSNLAANGQYNLLLETSDQEAHILINFLSTETALVSTLCENVTYSNQGTLKTYRNSNRNFPDVNGLSLYTDPTITNLGTCLGNVYAGAGTKTGGEFRAGNEIILKPNTSYLLRATNQANQPTIIQLNLQWYDK